MEGLTYDQWYITLSYAVAMKSKDRRTWVGAVVVGPDNEPVSFGFNSFVRGLNDDVPERQIKPGKHIYGEHAERNAIYNSTRTGRILKGCKLYLNCPPCTGCARGIISTGIEELILHKEWPEASPLSDDQKIALSMLEECKVKVRWWSGKIKQIRPMCDGIVLTELMEND